MRKVSNSIPANESPRIGTPKYLQRDKKSAR